MKVSFCVSVPNPENLEQPVYRVTGWLVGVSSNTPQKLAVLLSEKQFITISFTDPDQSDWNPRHVRLFNTRDISWIEIEHD